MPEIEILHKGNSRNFSKRISEDQIKDIDNAL